MPSASAVNENEVVVDSSHAEPNILGEDIIVVDENNDHDGIEIPHAYVVEDDEIIIMVQGVVLEKWYRSKSFYAIVFMITGGIVAVILYIQSQISIKLGVSFIEFQLLEAFHLKLDNIIICLPLV